MEIKPSDPTCFRSSTDSDGADKRVDLARIAESLESLICSEGDSLHALVSDLTGLADRLSGTMPRETSKAEPPRGSACHVARLDNALDDFRKALTRLQEETQRLHRVI